MTKSSRGKHAVQSERFASQIETAVSTTNLVVTRLKERLNGFEIPDFGSSLYASNNVSCVFHNTNDIIASLVTDRIINKFEAPSLRTEQRLKRECNEDWIAYERGHLSRVDIDSLSTLRKEGTDHWEPSDRGRWAIWNAASLVSKWMNGFSNGRYLYDRSFWSFIERAPIEFGPGESFKSLQGHVHLFNKLSPYNATVTEDALDLACLVIASNNGLRKIYANAIRTCADPGIREMTNHLLAFKATEARKSKLDYRIGVFAYRVREFLKVNQLVQNGSRGSSVYKNSTKRRFINVECLLNVILQKMVGYAHRQCLKINAGIDLDLGQDHHRSLIKLNVSTIDFSNASDSILTRLVEKLFFHNKKILSLMNTVRSHFVLIDTPIAILDGSKSVKMYHHPKKFSSMGNGFTFELLTLVTAAFARVFDTKASSYGDDVIISNDTAEDYMSIMRLVGFQPNLKKTFSNKPFRESCGGFFLDNYGYIRSYDFKWNHSIADVIVTCNKLFRIINRNPNWDHPVRDELIKAYKDILDVIPRTLRGPEVFSDDIPNWVESKNHLKIHMLSDVSKKRHRRHSTLIAELGSFYNCPNDSYSVRNWTVVMIPELVKQIGIKPVRDVKDIRLAFCYIYTGRVAPMLIRQQKDGYKFVFKQYFVHSSGVAIRAGTARRLVVDNRNALISQFIGKLAMLRAN